MIKVIDTLERKSYTLRLRDWVCVSVPDLGSTTFATERTPNMSIKGGEPKKKPKKKAAAKKTTKKAAAKKR